MGKFKLCNRIKKKTFNLSKGDQLRDYLHIDDVVKYIKNVSLKKKNIGILNICSNEPVSIIDLVNSWKVKYEWEIQIKTNMVPIKDYENNNFWGSNKKLKFILNNN
jgi:dTDP-6-deoxy-L-talose 4-dehydrogenase (NAD+)